MTSAFLIQFKRNVNTYFSGKVKNFGLPNWKTMKAKFIESDFAV